MVNKSSIIPGFSRFIDENVLSQYAPTSMKRILMASAVSLYLKQNENIVDNLINNPMFSSLGVANNNGMIDIETIRDTLKTQIKDAGFVRISIPFIGDIDFTTDDVDALYKFIAEANSSSAKPVTPSLQSAVTPSVQSISGGVY
jgi:chorismate mutase